jgi:hypothetical protein
MIIVNEAEIFQPIVNKIPSNRKEGNFTDKEIEAIRNDLKTIVKWFNLYRQHNNQFITNNNLVATSKELDPYYLYCGGAELTKLASKDWQMAIKIAREKSELGVIKDADANQEGFDYEIFSRPAEAKSKAYMFVPGKPIPNQWTGNKYSQCKTPLTMLLSIGCNYDGMIKKYWAALVRLNGHPDGKSGDWKYSAKSNDNAFSTFTLTKEITNRLSYQTLFGKAEDDFGSRGDGNALKGMKIILENV